MPFHIAFTSRGQPVTLRLRHAVGVDMAEAPAHIAELKRALGQRLADFRRAARLTQQQLARHTFVDRTYVSHAERGLHMPERAFWVAADTYLDAGGGLTTAYDGLSAAQHAVKQAELDALRARHLQPNGRTHHLVEVLRHDLVETFGTVLAAHSDRLPSALDLPLTAAHTVQAMEAFSGHDLVSRRHVLQQLSVLSGAALLQPVRQWIGLLPVVPASRIGLVGLDELEESVRLFRRWDAAGVGGLKRKAVVGQLNAVAENVLDTPDTGTRHRLFQILAEFAELAGWMSFDQGLHGAAQRYYLLALHACREAGAPELAAHVIGNMIKLSNALGHYNDSLNLARAGLYALSENNSLVRTELLGLEAQGYAGVGSQAASDAVRSIETGIAVWHDRTNEPQPDWLHHMTQAAEVDCGAANTYTQLALAAEDRPSWQRYAEQAERHTLSARQTRSNRYERSRIVDEVRLARVRLAQREPVEAVRVATHALAMTGQIKSSIVCDWLLRFHKEVAGRYGTLRQVNDFTRQLRDYLQSAGPSTKQVAQ